MTNQTNQPQGMSQYILQLVLAEYDRIDSLPPAEFDKEYSDFNARVRGMYGRPDCETVIH